MSLKVGVSNLNGEFTKKGEWIYLKSNESNIYRVLPPLFSLAEKGQYAKYYATHTIRFKDPNDPTAKEEFHKFQCVEKVNKNTKLIETHCPFCDHYREQLRKYELAKTQNVTKEQLDEFFAAHVMPYQVEKKFFISVIDQNNKVGTLPLGIKAYRALQDRLKDIHDKTGVDATGIKGAFLDFRKTQKFKGDRDTLYSVDKFEENVLVNGRQLTALKEHELTQELLNYIEKAGRDLGTLFRQITPEDIAALVSTRPESKKVLMDRIFSRPARPEEPNSNPLETNIEGTNAVSVARVEISSQGASIIAPQAIRSEVDLDTPPWETKTVTAQPTVPVQTVVKTEKVVSSTSNFMSDEDFLKFMEDSSK